MRITPEGQVTIPADIREKAGLLPDTEVEFQYDGEVVRLVKVETTHGLSRGELVVQHLRKHGGDLQMTTDEIMALTRGE